MNAIATKPKLTRLVFTEVFVPRWTFDERHVSQMLMKLPYVVAIDIQAKPEFCHGKTVTRMIVKSDPDCVSELHALMMSDDRVIDFKIGF